MVFLLVGAFWGEFRLAKRSATEKSQGDQASTSEDASAANN
jgi:hypothetical protein